MQRYQVMIRSPAPRKSAILQFVCTTVISAKIPVPDGVKNFI